MSINEISLTGVFSNKFSSIFFPTKTISLKIINSAIPHIKLVFFQFCIQAFENIAKSTQRMTQMTFVELFTIIISN